MPELNKGSEEKILLKISHRKWQKITQIIEQIGMIVQPKTGWRFN